MPGDNIDLSSDPSGEPPGRAECASQPYVGIHFACCAVYARIYRNRERTAYEGHCPRCSRRIRLAIGPDGTDCRFFTAY